MKNRQERIEELEKMTTQKTNPEYEYDPAMDFYNGETQAAKKALVVIKELEEENKKLKENNDKLIIRLREESKKSVDNFKKALGQEEELSEPCSCSSMKHW